MHARRNFLSAALVPASLMAVPHSARSASHGTAMSKNKAALIQAGEYFSKPDVRENYFRLYADNAVLHRSPPLAEGIEPIKAFYRAYWAAFPDITLTLGTMVEDASLLACEFTVQGTHQGPFLGIAATGRQMKIAGVTLLRFHEGQCVERWSQTDLLGLVRQLGGRVSV